MGLNPKLGKSAKNMIFCHGPTAQPLRGSGNDDLRLVPPPYDFLVCGIMKKAAERSNAQPIT